MRIFNKLDLDNHPLLSEHGTFRRAKNIQVSESGRHIENEDLLKQLQFQGYDSLILNKLNGYIATEDSIIIFDGTHGGVSIGLINSNGYKHITRILDNKYDNKRIHGAYTYNYKQELIVVFGTNDLEENSPEIIIININKEHNPTISLDTKEYNSLLLFPNYFEKIPKIDLEDISAGSLPSGTYFLSMRYVDENDNKSEFTHITRQIVITNTSLSLGVGDKIKKSGLNSGKSINIKISNLSENYDKIQLAILYYEDKTLKKINVTKDIEYNGIELNYTLSSITSLSSTSLSEIIIHGAKYIKAKSIINNGDKLVLLNLKTQSHNFKDYQKIANNIYITYHTKTTISGRTNASFPTAMATKTINSYKDAKNIYYDQAFKGNEIYNFYAVFHNKKGGVLSVNHIPAKSIPTIPTTLFVHETNNKYPNSYPDIAGQNMRFHKFPDSKDFMTANHYAFSGRPLLGIKINNVIIPNELRKDCSGWSIYYAERTLDNMTQYAQGFSHKAKTYDNSTNSYLDVTDFDKDYRTEAMGANPTRLYNNFFSFDLFYDKLPFSNIGKKLRKVYNTSNAGNGSINFSVGYQYYGERLSNTPTQEFNISDLKYYSGIDSASLDNFVGSKSDIILTFLELNRVRDLPIGIYDIELSTNKQNVYPDLSAVNLVYSGITYDSNIKESNEEYGGDIYLSRYFYIFINKTRNEIFSGGFEDAKRFQYAFIESNYNLELRHEGSEEFQIIYPQSNARKIMRLSKENINKGSYIKDDFGDSMDITYNKISNIENPAVITKELETLFPNRIARSDVNQSESTTLGWRNFKAESYRDLPGNSGGILKGISQDKNLYIQCINRLYLAQIKDVLQLADSEQAWLGSGDIFDREPTEVLYDDSGGIGCIDFDACLYTKYGYVVYDKVKNNFLLIGDGIQDLSLMGFKKWLSENNKGEVHINKDIHRDRLLLKVGDKTLSYSFKTKGLVCFHDYNYKFLISNRLGTYALTRFVSKFVNEPTNLVSYIDVNFIPNTPNRNLFQSIIFETEYSINNIVDYNKTIDEIMVYNDTQCSGILKVNKKKNWYDSNTGVLTGDMWWFNDFIDNVVNDRVPFLTDDEPNNNVNVKGKTWYNKSQFLSKFLTIRLQSLNKDSQRIKFISIFVELIKSNI
jgi:hypothetical protein